MPNRGRSVAGVIIAAVLLAGALAAPGGAEDREASLAALRNLAAQGKHKELRASARRYLDSFGQAVGADEARLLLARADIALGLAEEAVKALEPLLASSGASARRPEALLTAAIADSSRGAYASAAREILDALSAGLGEAHASRARATLAAVTELLSEDERARLRASRPSAPGIDIVIAGSLAYAQSIGDTAGARRLSATLSVAPLPQKAPSGGITVPATIRKKGGERNVARIGVLCPLSGRFAPLGEAFLRGAAIALKEARANGVKNIELIVGDTRGNPLVARAAAERLIKEERVDALLGEILSSSTIAAAQIAELEKTVLLSPVATEEGIDEIGEWVFQTSSGPDVELIAIARLSREILGATRIAFLSSDDPRSRRAERLFRGEVERLGGILCASVFFAEGTTDFHGEIERLEAAAPEALFIAADTEDLVLVLPQLSFYEFGVQLLGTSAWNSRRLIRMAGRDLEGAIIPADVDSRRAERLFAAAAAAVKEETGESGSVMVGGYDGVRTLIEAIRKAGTGDDALQRELSRMLEKRRHPYIEAIAGGGIPFSIIRGERVEDFATLGAPR